MGWKNDQQGLGDCYDFAQFTLNNGQSNYNVKTNQATLFLYVPIATKIILDSTQPLTFTFNNVIFTPIVFNLTDSPSEYVAKINVKNMYLSNASGNNATVRIWLFP